MQICSQSKRLAGLLVAACLVPTLSGCSPEKPTTAQAQELASCVVANATPGRLRLMGESYGLNGVTGMARTDAWDCKEARWKVALSPDYRKAVEPQVVAALTKNPAAREGMYAATFGRQFVPAQRAVIGKLGMFFDESRRATVQSLTCSSVEPQAMQIVSGLDLPFAIAVLGIQGNIGEPTVAQNAAQKLLDRVNLLLPAADPVACEKDNGKERFTEYARQMHQFYQSKHPWAPGCGVQPEGDTYKLVCTGVEPAKDIKK